MALTKPNVVDILSAAAQARLGPAYPALEAYLRAGIFGDIADAIVGLQTDHSVEFDHPAAQEQRLNWQGVWAIGIAYLEHDAVEHDGTSYVATADNTGVAPPAAPWEMLAAKGDDGAAGAPGPSNVIHETSGPTDLTAGAWPDGYLLKRTGNIFEGQDPAALAGDGGFARSLLLMGG